MAVVERRLRQPSLDQQVAGLDALETPQEPKEKISKRLWSLTWPKVAALGLALLLWQSVVWSGWKPEFILPGPITTFQRLWEDLQTDVLWSAMATTLRRGAWGFFLAVIIGSVVGLLVSRFRSLRAAVGSMITGLQTMPSIAWFPLAIVLFKLSEQAITFVVILGAAPSVANGLIYGIDHIPPNLLRAGRAMGGKGISYYRHVVLPAALPSFVGGLKQGWAFAWRSLMAGELIVVIANKHSLGELLDTNRAVLDYPGMLSIMLVILTIGIVLDSLVFAQIEKRIRAKWGFSR